MRGFPWRIAGGSWAVSLLEGGDALLPQLQSDGLIADTAFDAEERVIQPLQQAGQTPVIPPKSHRTAPRAYDETLYAERSLIETFFCKLTPVRASATRSDKTARNFLATIHLAAAAIWLNRGHALGSDQRFATAKSLLEQVCPFPKLMQTV